jgi:hypothetical protein
MEMTKHFFQGGTTMTKIVTYECDQCGCEVVVTSTPQTDLMPIYCCGLEVQEVAPVRKKAPAAKKKAKKTAKKVVKKPVARKKTAAKKKPAAGKKPTRKS